MAKENDALVIIEEGTDTEVKTEGLMCCWASFMIFYWDRTPARRSVSARRAGVTAINRK